ncbi:ATPase H(+)-transporting accessory protein 2-like [Drosophila montana]|uniref:ATPase H(+)-transporting accessory protein 2-like n=1 Tax=Drosophila montana TaxID=40370 RepID=UPI00313C1AEE
MLSIFTTFALFIAVVRGIGELSVLQCPKSMEFTGNDSLDSFYVGDVLLATLGNSVTGNSKWSGLTIKDPFELSQTTVILVHVKGVYRVETSGNYRVYELIDSDTANSIDNFVAQLEPGTVNDFNFINHNLGVLTYKSYFGSQEVPMAEPIRFLRPIDYLSHQNFLEEIGYMNAITRNLSGLLNSSQVIVFRLSLDRISKVTKYTILFEAKQLVAAAIADLLAAARNISNTLLFVQTTDKQMSASSLSRGHKSPNATNPFPKFRAYDYPIIFHIVLWLGIAYVLSLAVICCSIVNIDPGRDSIIYRMSSTHHYRSGLHKKKH